MPRTRRTRVPDDRTANASFKDAVALNSKAETWNRVGAVDTVRNVRGGVTRRDGTLIVPVAAKAGAQTVAPRNATARDPDSDAAVRVVLGNSDRDHNVGDNALVRDRNEVDAARGQGHAWKVWSVLRDRLPVSGDGAGVKVSLATNPVGVDMADRSGMMKTTVPSDRAAPAAVGPEGNRQKEWL